MTKPEIIKLLSKAELEEAINSAIVFFSKEKKIRSEVLHLQSKFSLIRKNFYIGIISQNDFNVEFSKINFAMIHILENGLENYSRPEIRLRNYNKPILWSLICVGLLSVLVLMYNFNHTDSNKDVGLIIEEGEVENIIGVNEGTININPKEDASLVLNDRTNTNQNLGIENDVKIGIDKKYLSRFYKIIDFTISNPSNTGIIVVDKIFLENLGSTPFYICEFPEGPAKPIEKYEFKVELFPQVKEYIVTSDLFKYSGGDIDEFEIKTFSDSTHLYNIRAGIEYYNVKDPNERKITYTEEHLIGFPERFSLRYILAEATKVELFINDQEALGSFLGRGSLYFWLEGYDITDKDFKIIVVDYISNRLKYASINKDKYSVVDEEEFKKVEEINKAFFKDSHQFIIIDDRIVIQHIGYFEAQYFTDKEVVSSYNKLFDDLFEE